MAASRHGSFGEFDSGSEDWASYTERLQQHYAANEIEAVGKQRAILLSCCGPQTYQLIKNLLAPEKPTDKTYAEIVQLVKDHLDPKPSLIVQRYIFHSRSRKESELVAAFVAELRRLSEHCGFGDVLQDMLRDRLVCGINDGHIQRRLLAEPELTYKKAFDIAQAVESAERNAKDLQAPREREIHLMKDESGLSELIRDDRTDSGAKGGGSLDQDQVHSMKFSARSHTRAHVHGQGGPCYTGPAELVRPVRLWPDQFYVIMAYFHMHICFWPDQLSLWPDQ